MSSLVREVVELAKSAEATAQKLSRRGDLLRLADTGAAAESVNDVIDAVTAMVGVLAKRVEEISGLEVVGSGRDSALDLLEEAALDLELGHDGLVVARRLLGNGRGHLLTVERGEDRG